MEKNSPKRQVVTMRMSDSMRDRIKAAATAAGRSVTQEIETRLERSFQEERSMGGPEANLAARMLSSAIGLIEDEMGKAWVKDRLTWEAVSAALHNILGLYKPRIDDNVYEGGRESLDVLTRTALEADELNRRVKGLQDAYWGIWMPETDAPPAIVVEYKRASAELEKQVEELRAAAKACIEGPLGAFWQKIKSARKLGREFGSTISRTRRGSIDLMGIARMDVETSRIEPMDDYERTLRLDARELWSAIERLANMGGKDLIQHPQA